jgi:hypothetical protein
MLWPIHDMVFMKGCRSFDPRSLETIQKEGVNIPDFRKAWYYRKN